MLEMSSLGAKVMQPASIQDARLNRINIDVKSSFVNKPGNFNYKKKKYFKIKLLQEYHLLKMIQK